MNHFRKVSFCLPAISYTNTCQGVYVGSPNWKQPKVHQIPHSLKHSKQGLLPTGIPPLLHGKAEEIIQKSETSQKMKFLEHGNLGLQIYFHLFCH